MKRSVFRALLFALLALSAALRTDLALRGGQRFFPDENRYLRSTILVRFLEQGRPGDGLDLILSSPDHTGFILVGLVPALAQRAWIAMSGGAPGREGLEATLWLPACLLSFASVASIALVAAIARRAGAEREAALTAAFLMSCAMTLFYYSRHLLPYDCAMALALFGLWLGTSERRFPGRLLVGLVAGAAFMTYNGYWMSALATLVVSVPWRAGSPRDLVARGVPTALGFIILPAVLTAATIGLGRPAYVLEMARFSREAATQFEFSEGWSLPVAFLWDAEHGLLIVLVLGALVTGFRAFRDRSPAAMRGLGFLAVALGMYLLMGLLSHEAERIGVFGRQVRQVIPFLCLAAACGLSTPSPPHRRRNAAVILVALGLATQAALAFASARALRYPADFAREAVARFGPMDRGTTVEVSSPPPPGVSASRYVLLNAQFLYPVRVPKEAPAGTVVLQAPHPLQFRLYQYEGFVPAERALLGSLDVSMRVIDTGGPPRR